MRIKKHPTGNEYILAGDVWVRNFTKPSTTPLQLTHMFKKEDYETILKNEELNKNNPKVSDETIMFNKAVIVSDGYDFDKRHLLLAKLPKDVAIFTVNKAFAKWKLMSAKLPGHERRTMNGFIVNNPYRECLSCLPPRDSKYWPTCVASTRTNYEFCKNYSGDVYLYVPTPEMKFGFEGSETYYIDDYRNPICAAIGLVYQFGVSKLLLFCCDDSFADKRDFAVELPNGLYTYPHQLKSQEIIDANLYWLTHQTDKEVKVADYSSGANYANAAYITSEEDALNFFRDQEEGTPNVN